MQASFDDAVGLARVADVPSLPHPWTHAAGDNVSPVAVSTAARLWFPADDAPLLARQTGPGQLLFHIVAAYSCGGQYVAGERVNCTCQPALPTHSCLGAYMWPGDGSTVLASRPQPPRLFVCGFMWGPICGRGTGRLYLPAGPTHPQLSGGLYVARGWVDCTCQPAPTTQTLWLWIYVGANMRPGNGSTVLASQPYPPTRFWEPSFSGML